MVRRRRAAAVLAAAERRIEDARATGLGAVELSRALRLIAADVREARALLGGRVAVADGRGLRIAVPLRQFSHGMGGTEMYTRSVLAGLVNQFGAALTIFTVAGQVDTLREAVPGAEFRVVPDTAAGLAVDDDLDPDRHDVVFCMLNTLDPQRPALPAAVTIHGISHEFIPSNFDERILALRQRTYRPAAIGADLVFTVSEFSKRSICERYGIAEDKVLVAPCAAAPVFHRPAPIEPSPAFRDLRLPDDYLFYPANFWLQKNHANLLEAIALLGERAPLLVLAGDPSTGGDRVGGRAAELGIADRVRLLGFVSQELIFELMRHARAIPFVTQFEGFGMPLVEAFHARAPLITTRGSAAEDVAGDAALYVDPLSPRSIADAIERILSDGTLARALCARGDERARLFSWERSVEIIHGGLAGLVAARAAA